MSLKLHHASNMFSIFLIGIIYPLLISCSFRGTLLDKKASFFEEQVRSGDVLPKAMVELICVTQQIRFLIIGGRVAAADNVLPNQTYPYLLCNGDKIVGEGVRPDAIAPCMKKMIGDNVYDAIVIDLYEPNPLIIRLTQRLARRFPDATIINMREWFPCSIGFQHRQRWVNVATWARSFGYNSMTQDALTFFKQSNRPWTMKLNNEAARIFDQNSNENYIWSLYKDTKDKANIKGQYWKDTLSRRAWMFDDWCLPNAYGHQDIARGVLGMMIYNETRTNRSNFVNPWDDDDEGACM